MAPIPGQTAPAPARDRDAPERAAPGTPPDAAERRAAGVAAGSVDRESCAADSGRRLPRATPEQDLGLAFARARAMLEWIARAAGVVPGDGACNPSCGPAARPSADEP
ncbi:hypothetical protein [Dokdonella koreensis]|uniref:Uncharacterized protein n=1 Tax=Dokdonella koreensis DS-123 TaxID=1300342 RepID=A0A160DX44_9GAMM|nr:hypothetical protein [Dokdonella koreensis]ANB18880.1 Hypothetical protein I596_2887 [Dokdonella koreensis DS-123]